MLLQLSALQSPAGTLQLFLAQTKLESDTLLFDRSTWCT